MRRGADHVMQALAAQGVTDIFALSGNQIMPLFDASLNAKIRLYHTRHEAATVYMAEGYAQISGGVGIALVTAGAGLGNAIGPLLTSRASDTPVVLLSGDSPAGLDGQGAFQEMDQVALTQSLTKWSVRPTRVEDLFATITRAVEIATSGRPGPVHVSLPADVLLAEGIVSPVAEPVTAGEVETDALSQWIAAADTPLVVLGPALNETRAPGLAGALSKALGAPVVAMESPRGLNDPALGHLAPVFAEADRILLLGKPLDFTLRLGASAPNARWAVVNADEAECARAKRNVADRLEIALHQCARTTAKHLSKSRSENARRAWRETVAKLTVQRYSPLQDPNAILPNDLTRAVQDVLNETENPIVVCDGGEFGQWAQAGVTAPRRVINGVSGSIGGGLCYAMAARAADPTATVFSLMGDGTAGFHFAEFETAVREDLPFIAIIGNDQSWNAEHQIQLRDYGADRLHGCTLSSARYDDAVIALGAFGVYVETPADLPGAIRAAIASGKPACINVKMVGLPAPTVS
jgi:acetolactate synthase-1/2/3 large subunit